MVLLRRYCTPFALPHGTFAAPISLNLLHSRLCIPRAFVTDSLDAVQSAKDLPDTRQTIAGRKEARINLLAATRQVRSNWQLLKIYITKAFDKSMVQAKLDAAGAALYPKASVDNWSSVRSLIDAANTFIANNIDELSANDNMPADFQTAFKTAGDNCIALSVIFAKADMEKEMATSTKVIANNAIYSGVIEMLKDGQQIFKDDAAMKKQFTFSYLVAMHRGEGTASLRGTITDNFGMPVAGAVILSDDQKYTATTNSKGYYRINRIAAGAYTFTISCAGYDPIVQVITFEAAKASKGDFELTKALSKVA
ncbi:MAG: carboxypeptidase regulatory-like domain-containing protein [Ginsengibacter sp.]